VKTFILAALAVMAVAGCGNAGAGSQAPSASTGAGTSSATTTAITERDFRFDEPALSVPSGTALEVTNAGPTVHNLAIRSSTGAVLATTSDLKPGTSETLPLQLAAGTYPMFCSLPGHESLGLKGTLTVTP
jgi:plastocyanin